MARVTIEDCLEQVPTRFGLIHLAAKRVRQIFRGVWIFCAALCIGLGVVLEFQPLALWLPSFMK